MIDKVDNLCCGCSVCEKICPKKCISMLMNAEGFLHPVIDEEKCLHCDACEKVCPVLKPIENDSDNYGYIVRVKQHSVLESSASGGFFTPIAEYFIENEWPVCAAVLDENWRVKHIVSFDKEDVTRMRGSKYVQSDISGCFEKVKDSLVEGRRILFCGTPCQVQAIKRFITKTNLLDNLYTIDVACKGVGSPKLWHEYIDYQKKKNKATICGINFREKVHGYHSSNMVIRFANGKKISASKTDLFMKAYVGEFCSRSSCYSCQFKGVNRCSDFTIFDAWHMNELVDNIKDDDKGYTTLITHSVKAEQLLRVLKDKYDIYPIDIDMAVQMDGIMLTEQPHENANRKKFLIECNNSGIVNASKRYCSISLRDRITEISKNLLYSIGMLQTVKKIRNYVKGK
jgi:coenzyme F420-reducing hydrogenase beta subunit